MILPEFRGLSSHPFEGLYKPRGLIGERPNRFERSAQFACGLSCASLCAGDCRARCARSKGHGVIDVTPSEATLTSAGGSLPLYHRQGDCRARCARSKGHAAVNVPRREATRTRADGSHPHLPPPKSPAILGEAGRGPCQSLPRPLKRITKVYVIPSAARNLPLCLRLRRAGDCRARCARSKLFASHTRRNDQGCRNFR